MAGRTNKKMTLESRTICKQQIKILKYMYDNLIILCVFQNPFHTNSSNMQKEMSHRNKNIQDALRMGFMYIVIINNSAAVISNVVTISAIIIT